MLALQECRLTAADCIPIPPPCRPCASVRDPAPQRHEPIIPATPPGRKACRVLTGRGFGRTGWGFARTAWGPGAPAGAGRTGWGPRPFCATHRVIAGPEARHVRHPTTGRHTLAQFRGVRHAVAGFPLRRCHGGRPLPRSGSRRPLPDGVLQVLGTAASRLDQARQRQPAAKWGGMRCGLHHRTFYRFVACVDFDHQPDRWREPFVHDDDSHRWGRVLASGRSLNFYALDVGRPALACESNLRVPP